MANGLPYYPRYPRDLFEGTAGMPIADKGPYGLILDLIYLHDGSLPDNRRYIAGMLGMSVRALNLVLPRLVKSGKLAVIDGTVTNTKADLVLKTTRTKKAKADVIPARSQDYPGIISGSSQDNPAITERLANENSEPSRARVIQNQNHKEREEHDDDDATFREQLLKVMGVDGSGLTGRGGSMLGTRVDMAEASRWLELPEMTPQVILEGVAEVMRRKQDGPPSSFRYFRAAMLKISGALSEPAISQTGAKNVDEPDRRQYGPRSGSAPRDAETLSRIVRAAAEEAA